jgi:hypothetical protein
MKILKGIFLIATLICWNNYNRIAAQPVKSLVKGFVFTHPGMLNSKAELNFIKAKITAGEEPWKSALNKMKSSYFGNTGWVPKPISVVDADWSPSKNDAGTENDDATAAYTQALLWYFTGNESYAKKSVEILNAWAVTLTGHTSKELQKQLVAGWCGSLFPMAAEIMRASYPKWTGEEISKFSAMLNKAFLPLLINGNPTFNGNWELSMINAMMCIGVFNEDTTTFNKAIFLWQKRVSAYIYLTTDGISPVRPYGTSNYNSESGVKGYWFNPTKYFDGLCQETCRDWGHHMQMGLASAINSAEIAWHQGIDLYSENDKRFVAAMEFQASTLIGNPAPKEFFPNGYVTSDLLPTWEIAYNHFHNRKGLAMPMTDALITKKIRPSYFTTMLNMAWETVTHAQVDNNVGTSIPNQLKTDGGYSLKIVPNPVGSNFTVQYTVKELSPVEFTMRDINGKLIEIQQNIIVQSGSGEFNWTIKNSTPPGIYFISMQQKGEKVAVCKVVKTNIN